MDWEFIKDGSDDALVSMREAINAELEKRKHHKVQNCINDLQKAFDALKDLYVTIKYCNDYEGEEYIINFEDLSFE